MEEGSETGRMREGGEKAKTIILTGKKRSALMGYYKPHFCVRVICLAAIWWVGVNEDPPPKGLRHRLCHPGSCSFPSKDIPIPYLHAPHDFQSFRLWSFHQSLASIWLPAFVASFIQAQKCNCNPHNKPHTCKCSVSRLRLP